MNDKINFTARNPIIRDAQWVANSINANFPHVSDSKIKLKLQNLILQNSNLLTNYTNACKNNSNTLSITSGKEKKLVSLCAWYTNLVTKTTIARIKAQTNAKNNYDKINNIIKQLKIDKIANCGEEAEICQVILKLNGKDSTRVKLFVDNIDTNHTVCVFNKDNKPFDGKANKNSIIIDSWLGIADYADNVFTAYKNLYSKYFCINKKTKFQLREVYSPELNEQDLLKLRNNHPELVYKGKNFMK